MIDALTRLALSAVLKVSRERRKLPGCAKRRKIPGENFREAKSAGILLNDASLMRPHWRRPLKASVSRSFNRNATHTDGATLTSNRDRVLRLSRLLRFAA